MSKPRRVYPLALGDLTEEQLAVTFAMTSRRPEAFDEIATKVTEEKAAAFHERWVLGYGHASVAEHAVLHLAVENISRLTADTLEDNRLASYTEKSSRYQIIDQGDYYIPLELDGHQLRNQYVEACDHLFNAYRQLVDKVKEYLNVVRPPVEGEREASHNLRLRREATDSCRFLLPGATLTNVGVTINARSLEHAITKLLSSNLAEERELGEDLKTHGQSVTPTLVKYADYNSYLAETRKALQQYIFPPSINSKDVGTIHARLVSYDRQAENKIIAALCYPRSNQTYKEVASQVRAMSRKEKQDILDAALEKLGPHDIPVRELEFINYTFDLTMDYGAYREFKRHRMQSYLKQPLTVDLGYLIPPLVAAAGQTPLFQKAMEVSAKAYHKIAPKFPTIAPYLVTHAHVRRVLSQMNLRECYHFFQLRTGPQTHFTLQEVARKAMLEATSKHPALFHHLRLRS